MNYIECLAAVYDMLYIRRLADNYKGHASSMGAAPGPNIFVA
jgi:hypothetical protein